MEKQEKEIKKPRENKKKHKRKVSIFTVFLWLFLIITMSVITIGTFTQKNAIEVTDNNWNIQLVMYDRSSDTPDQSITDFTWNATSSNETRQLAMQINYTCTTGKEYKPGEIIVRISGIPKESFSEYWRNLQSYKSESYENWLKNKVVVAADKENSSNKQYDWSYVYDEKNNVYTFTNNMTVAENEHFEGTIQIVYNLLPKLKIQTDLEFQAKIEENIEADEIIVMESNICNFHYTGTKSGYRVENYASVAHKTDYTKIEDILDNYYWVRYNFHVDYRTEGTIRAFDTEGESKDYLVFTGIKETLPEGCVMYDKNLNKLEPKEGNTYYYLGTCINPTVDYSSDSCYYVGYPKDKYQEGDSITNTAELWGRYEDEEEIQKLAEDDRTVRLIDFDFEYKGDLYDLDKASDNYVNYFNELISERGRSLGWKLYPIAFYTDHIMDVEIGDDLLYITRKNGEVTKLEDNEYHFTNVSIPVFYTYNKYSGSKGDVLIGYEWELQVRYAGTEEYVSYQTGISGEGKYFSAVESTLNDYIEFDNNNIVGVKIVIKNLDKTIYQPYDRGYGPCVYMWTNIHTHDCIVGGRVYNFSYFQIYHKNEEGNRILVNEPTLDSYTTIPIELKVPENDLATYGTYMQRAYGYKEITDGCFELNIEKEGDILRNNVKEEKYTYMYKLHNNFDLYYYEINKDVIIKTYDILPEGIYLGCNEKEIINNLYLYDSKNYYKNLKLKDGTNFTSRKDLEEYIKEHVQVEIDYDYKGSGRTKISIITNLNEIDWSYYLTDYIVEPWFYIEYNIEVEIPYESILEYGTNYTNYIYGMWNNQENAYDDYDSIRYLISDNGKYDNLASDIDQDGDIEEKLLYKPYTFNITHAVSSQQAVVEQVRTDLTQGKYVEGLAEVSPGGEYDYKLRVTTGANSIKDLILYDNIETILNESGTDVSTGWKGSFLGVDTNYAERKGYAPKVYYSTELNPGKLTEVPDKWQLLDDSVDKSTVKSICVDLRYKTDGSEMELSPNNVVFVLVKMQAPDDENLMTSANNMFWTNWKAIDPLGGIVDNVEGIYSNQVNVEINKTNITTSISGQKTWIDEDNKNDTRPANITVKLMQDGVEYAVKSITESDNWSYTFENVPVYRNNEGDQYEYTIEEEPVENYITSYKGNNIINEVNLTEFEVEKIWEDNNNEKQKRPESIVVELKIEGKTVQEVTLNEETNWKYTFTNLEKYNELGEEIVYTADEQEFTNGEWYVKEIVGGKITNKLVVPDERVKMVGSKSWDDNNNLAGKRPESVVLQVKNGEEVVTEQVVTEKENWSYEFELAKYDENGNEIVYTIDEKEVGSKFYEKVGVEGNVVTNKFVVPDEKIEIWVDKKWEDEDNKYGKRPESVILQIKNGENVVEEVEVSEENNWRHKFELTKYDELGNEINYTVDEKETAEYYEKSIEENTIINTCTYTPSTDTSDISVWVYVVVAIIAIVGIGVFVFVRVKQKKNLNK